MLPGFRHLPSYLDSTTQVALLAQVAAALDHAPLYKPTMPRVCRPLSVSMSNAGTLGWYSDRSGYRYIDRHPLTGRPWPAIPPLALALWRELADYPHPPEACLINYYQAKTRLSLHRDYDETALAAPVLSISLGDAARFRLGGLKRGDRTETLRLVSGDIVILGGTARLAFHGVDRIEPGSSGLLARGGFNDGGRINLTLRRVTMP